MKSPTAAASGPAPVPLLGQKTPVVAGLLGCVVCAIAAGFVLTWIRSWIVNPGPETAVSAARVDAARFARQALFFSFAIACVFIRPHGRPPFLVATGFVPAKRAIRSYAAGFLAGAIPIIALIVVLVLLGARRVELRASVGKLAWYTLKFVLLGIGLVVLEEAVFRGLVLGDLARAFGVRTGVVVASAFFAATHFLGVSDAWRAVPDPNPGASRSSSPSSGDSGGWCASGPSSSDSSSSA